MNCLVYVTSMVTWSEVCSSNCPQIWYNYDMQLLRYDQRQAPITTSTTLSGTGPYTVIHDFSTGSHPNVLSLSVLSLPLSLLFFPLPLLYPCLPAFLHPAAVTCAAGSRRDSSSNVIDSDSDDVDC